MGRDARGLTKDTGEIVCWPKVGASQQNNLNPQIAHYISSQYPSKKKCPVRIVNSKKFSSLYWIQGQRSLTSSINLIY